MSDRVFITGFGIISSIGFDAKETLDSLLDGKSGIGEITLLDTIHKGKFPLAEVKMTTDELLQATGNSGRKDLTRTALLGMIAAREAVDSAGMKEMTAFRTGLVSASTVGGMDRSEIFYQSFLQDNRKGRLIDVVNHDCGESTERIAKHIGIKHFATTISTACSSSANAIMFGSELIKSGKFDRIIAGGTDAVTKFTLNGFNTLMILDRQSCKPFDDNRAGLTLGEGAAFIVLESEAAVLKEAKQTICELKGYGNANDAYHQTASSPEGTGAFLAMKKAITMSGLLPDQIGYVNVHGTGTQNNDLSEGVALERIFNGDVPRFSSTKSFTGHTLGAAGAVEAVISILAIRHGSIWPNLNFTTQMKELKIKPEARLIKDIEVGHVLSNSFGFGGNNSTLIFSKI
jgi:3-oxoacyl-(acyl-carrier-protein) synthase